MAVPTPYPDIPAYLKAVTVLEPAGDPVGETVAAVAKLWPWWRNLVWPVEEVISSPALGWLRWTLLAVALAAGALTLWRLMPAPGRMGRRSEQPLTCLPSDMHLEGARRLSGRSWNTSTSARHIREVVRVPVDEEGREIEGHPA